MLECSHSVPSVATIVSNDLIELSFLNATYIRMCSFYISKVINIVKQVKYWISVETDLISSTIFSLAARTSRTETDWPLKDASRKKMTNRETASELLSEFSFTKQLGHPAETVKQ